MPNQVNFRVSSVVLGSPEPQSLAAFYRALLAWEVAADEPEWVKLEPPGGGTGLSFQIEADHVPPVWPSDPGDQQMQVHLDIYVSDLDAGVTRAVELGAHVADHQPLDDGKVMIDPDGHLFCLWSQ